MAKDRSSKVTIVAIGASAGGLDPYERFFDNTKDDSGVAYVIIQHLSPNFQSMMDELLSRHSQMNIERVIDGMAVEANTIYLNPPRTEMIVKDGHFKLTAFSDNKLLNLPIDTFFHSLAEEAGENAIAVVLSGTGSDGTKGAEAIKAAGGTVLAQDLASAKFDGMPGSIIKLGFADAIGYPEMLAENVGRIIRGLPVIEDPNLGVIKSPAQRIFQRLLDRFGTEFNYYKPATIDRRLERRAGLRNLNLEDYAAVIAAEPAEAEALYADLLIEVTSFFRDPEAFESLRKKVVPELAKSMSKAKPVRIWVPGCASGEEAYSIAILFADYARENHLELHLKILATDIHHRSLDKASTGVFPRSSLGGLSQEQIERYFDQDDQTYQIKPNLRRMVVFSPHNILKDPPFTRMDLIACRNVLIYFNDLAQKKTLALFHFALRKSGFLFLGPSETTGKLEEEFSQTDAKWRIFEKRRDVRLLESVSLLPLGGSERDGFEAGNIRRSNTVGQSGPIVGPVRQAHNDTLKEMLRRYAPPGFLLAQDGEIAHVFGDAGQFLQVASGVFSNKITDLVDTDLKMIITSGLERVKGAAKLRFERRVKTHNDEHGSHSVVITIDRMSSEDAPQQYMLLTLERVKEKTGTVNLSDVETMGATEANSIMQSRIQDLERDLRSTEESLQSTIEELETSNEELQATNEELMASNEELQSTNEELHSVNEELYTVSTEHQRKIEELMEATDDMDHLLRATDIGIVFLDDQMQIRRFTPSAKDTFNIIPQDIGRPIDHITYRFDSSGLLDKIADVRASGVVHEEEVTVGERTYMLRILPYRTTLLEIVGSVLTTIDITDIKEAERDRTETAKKYEAIVRDLTDWLIRWSPKDGVISYGNETLSNMLSLPLNEIVGSNIDTIIPIGKDIKSVAKGKNGHLDRSFENQVMMFDASGRKIRVSGTVRQILDEDGNVELLQATGRDVTDEFNYRNALETLLQLQESARPGQEMALLDDILSLGKSYLGMTRGVIGRIDGDQFYVTNMDNTDPNGASVYKLGERTPSKTTIASAMVHEDNVFAMDDLNKLPASARKLLKDSAIRCSIGSTISTADGHKGRISFGDSKVRERPFGNEEKMFVRLLGQIIGAIIERFEYEKDLQYRHQQYLSVYDQAPIMRCTIDQSGKILEANAVWQSTLGVTEKKSIGADFLDFVSDKALKSEWAKFPKLSKSDGGRRSTITTLASKKMKGVIVEMTVTQLHDPRSGEAHFLVAMVDITDRQTAFDRIEKQKLELEKANEGLSTFAYVASHDLQEPLRKIRQFVDLLEDENGAALDKDGKYYLSVITGSAARISYLVKDILAYTTASNADVEIQELELNEILEEVVEDAEEQIEARAAKVTIGKMPAVSGDWGASKLLFQNLLSNALKYQAEGAVPEVTIKSRKLKTHYVIDVADNGIGVDEVKGKSIFEPFVRLHSKFEYAGTGIGLAICNAVCQRMGWEMSHKPNPKGGTVFSIKIKR